MSRTRYVAQAGAIAALHAALTFLVVQSPLGYGPVQLRLSEVLMVLAFLTPAAVPGLTLGNAVANGFLLPQLGPFALLDVVFGSLGTLLAALWIRRFRDRTLLALAGPVVANALIVPAYLPFILQAAGIEVLAGYYEVPFLKVNVAGRWLAMYLFGVVAVAAGQAVVMYGLGLPLLVVLRRLRLPQDEGVR